MNTQKLRKLIKQRLRSSDGDSTGGLVKYIKEKFGERLEMSDDALKKKVRKILEEEVKRGNVENVLVKIKQKRDEELYERPVQGWRIKIKRKRTKMRLHIPYRTRLSHTEDLKREVIRPWLEQLPDAKDVVYSFKKKSKLPVESVSLFNDFKLHVCYGPDPFSLLETLKEEADECKSKLDDLSTDIKKLLEALDFSPLHCGTVLEHILYWAAGKRERGLLDFPLWRALSKENTHKKNMILKISIKQKPYQSKAKEILSIIKGMERLNEDLKGVLKKHLYHPGPFPGDYRFLSKIHS